LLRIKIDNHGSDAALDGCDREIDRERAFAGAPLQIANRHNLHRSFPFLRSGKMIIQKASQSFYKKAGDPVFRISVYHDVYARLTAVP
jgi:hypothetical protein